MAYNISLNTAIIRKDMNKQIRELMEQADILFLRDGTIMPGRGEADIQKFAELILKKCMTLFENAKVNQEDDVDYGLEEAQNIIKEHFGFKEPQGWVCPKCGVDRIKASCPQGHTAALTGDCPMYGIAL